MRIRSLSIWWIAGFALLVPALACAIWWIGLNRVRREAASQGHLTRAQQAAERGQWGTTAQELHGLLAIEPDSDGAWLMLAETEFRRGQVDEALRCVSHVPSRSANGPAARLLEGTLLLNAGQASRAETVLNECLKLDPDNLDARRRLVFLYAIELRREELRQVLWELHELRALQTTDLVLLSGSTFIVWNAAEIAGMIERYAASDERDVAARVAAGRYRLRQNELDAARAILEEACRLAPNDEAPRAALADCLLDRGEFEELRQLIERIPPGRQPDAHFAFCRGRIAEEADELDAAIEAYRVAVRSDEDDREANYRLGQLLVHTGRAPESERPLVRAQKLAERETLLSTLVTSGDASRYTPILARLEVELGHERLAAAWYAEAVRQNPNDESLRAEAAAFAKRAADDSARSTTNPH